MAADQPRDKPGVEPPPAEHPERLVRDSVYRPGTWFESANYAVEGVITA